MDLNQAYIGGLALLVLAATALLWRGHKAHIGIAEGVAQVFRYNRTQRWVTIAVGIPVLVFVAALPLLWLPLQSASDIALMFATLTGYGALLIEVSNRRVLTTDSHILTVSWSGNLLRTEWQEVKDADFHNVFGGFFILHEPRRRVYVPVQVERPTDLLRVLEQHLPAKARSAARRGIELCRSHLN